MRYFVIAILTIIIIATIRTFRKKKGSTATYNSDLIDAGPLLFPDRKQEFQAFYSLFLQDRNAFIGKNAELLARYDNFELDKLKPIEILYIFADSNHRVCFTDWRGEENEREIERFLEDNLRVKADWKNADEVRKGVDEEGQRDGKFIIDLLRATDKDLEPLNKKLLFFDLSWDAYVYTVVDETSFRRIIEQYGTHFHGIEKLRK